MSISSTLTLSASIAEYTDVVGYADYTLLGAIAGSFTFADADGRVSGDTVTYHVTDGPNVEIVTGIYTAAGVNPASLSRDTILTSSNGGNAVFWSGQTRPIIREIVEANTGGTIDICATTPWDGADLVWQEVDSKWCPDQRIYGRNATALSNNNGNDVTLLGGSGDGSGRGGRIIVLGGSPGTSNGAGGYIDIRGEEGNGTGAGGGISLSGADGGGNHGAGGDISINAGNGGGGSTSSNGGRGGEIEFFCGDGEGSMNGGSFQVFCGDGGNNSVSGANGDAGDVLIFAGDSFGNGGGRGGDVQLFSGHTNNAAQRGGDMFLFAGSNNAGSGNGGDVEIDAGTGINGGNVILGPGNADSGGGKIGVLWLYDTSPLIGGPPTTNPSVGYYIYIDTSDGNKLKARGTSGTITTLATP